MRAMDQAKYRVLKLVNIIQMFAPDTNIKLALSTTEFLMGAN